MRRSTTLTNEFSKKLENHRAAFGLHVGRYNLCDMHESLRCTPAMALRVTDHVRTIGKLVEQALFVPKPVPNIPVPSTPRPTEPKPPRSEPYRAPE